MATISDCVYCQCRYLCAIAESDDDNLSRVVCRIPFSTDFRNRIFHEIKIRSANTRANSFRDLLLSAGDGDYYKQE